MFKNSEGVVRARIALIPQHEAHNEVQEYVKARYVSATYAIWRIFDFAMHSQSIGVKKLPVHLQNLARMYRSNGVTFQLINTSVVTDLQVYMQRPTTLANMMCVPFF